MYPVLSLDYRNPPQEIDVAASVEHLRDQRPSMVKTADQYKFIYACVAQEVSALLKVIIEWKGEECPMRD